MNKAGDLLSSFLDNQLLKSAKSYSELFAFWQILVSSLWTRELVTGEFVTGDKVAAHSRIVELERGVLLVEADHPGWIQILQTRQRPLLERLRRRFPDLALRGIAFRLSRTPVSLDAEKAEVRTEPEPRPNPPETETPESLSETPDNPCEITDPALKEVLKRLKQSITLNYRSKRDSS